MPGSALFGWNADTPEVSPQHAVSVVPSSNVTMIIPFFLYAGEFMISGIQMCRKPLISVRPPGSPSAQGASCPSMHRLGETHEKFGLVDAEDRSFSSGWKDRMCASQYAWFPITDLKYMKPSCRVAYWSAAVAPSVGSDAPIGGGAGH